MASLKGAPPIKKMFSVVSVCHYFLFFRYLIITFDGSLYFGDLNDMHQEKSESLNLKLAKIYPIAD